MTVIVSSKQMKVTEGLRHHAETQAQKLLRLGKRIAGVRVYLETVRKKSNDHMANIVTYCVRLPGKTVVVTKTAVDMYQAIVQATESAARQVRKQYEKRRDSKRHTHHRSSETMMRTS